jgi:hypothetical protein
MKKSDVKTYIHRELNQEVTAIGGYYLLNAEVRLPFQGRDILYLTGYAHFDTSCCGAGGCSYVLVPGFIVDWKIKKNREGCHISHIEPVRDPILRRQIRGLIESKTAAQQIRFE